MIQRRCTIAVHNPEKPNGEQVIKQSTWFDPDIASIIDLLENCQVPFRVSYSDAYSARILYDTMPTEPRTLIVPASIQSQIDYLSDIMKRPEENIYATCSRARLVASLVLDIIGRDESYEDRSTRLNALRITRVCDFGHRAGTSFTHGYYDSPLCPYCDSLHGFESR